MREQPTIYERYVKRALDVSLSGAALVVLSPLMLATAAAVKLDSKGPVLFCQQRLGLLVDLLALLVGDERALNTRGLAAADGRIQHIAHADKLFRTGRIKDYAAFHRGRDGKCDSRRDVRLHKSGDDIR